MDSNNNLDKLDNLPRMIKELYFFSKEVDIKFRKLDNIYIMGKTDGRIAGYLLQTLLLHDIKVPIIIEDINSIPGFISKKTCLCYLSIVPKRRCCKENK